MVYRLKGLFIILILIFYSLFLEGQEKNKLMENKKIYYPNGKLLSEGFLMNGKPEGYWKTFYTSGILKSEGNRNFFLLDSVWIFYNSVGDTVQKINYLEGKKNGYFYTYNTSRIFPENIGKIISKELYVNDSKEGKSFYYTDAGLLNEIVEYKNDKKNDICLEYGQDGRIITINRFQNGFLIERERINRYNEKNEKDGIWLNFYEGVKTKIEINYKDGLMEGYYKEYSKEGNLILTLLYKDGKLIEEVGKDTAEIIVSEIRDKDGKIIETGLFKKSIPVGVHKIFNKDGVIISSAIYNNLGIVVSEGIIDKEGKRSGKWIDYYSDKKICDLGNYINNLRDGPWTFFFEDGSIEQKGVYLKGKEDGKWTWYYNSGHIWREEEFINGKEEGFYKEIDTTGKVLVAGQYFDGAKEGDWKIAINDFSAEGNYANDFKDGKWRYFYDDGTLMFEGNFIQGNPEGEHKYYFPNGKLKEEQFYINGIPDKHWKKYDEEGNLIVTITYQDGKEYRINGAKIELPYSETVIIK